MARPDDDLPDIEVVGGAREARTEVEIESVPSRRARRPWTIAVVAAVVTLAAVGLSSRGDGTGPEGDESQPSTTTTEERSTTSTSRRASTTTSLPEGEYLTGNPAPVLGEVVYASVVLGNGTSWRQLNLDTGWVEELPILSGANTWGAVPVVDGIMIYGPDARVISLPPVAPGTTRERAESVLRVGGPDDPGEVLQLLPTGQPDRVWIVTETADSPGPTFRQRATLVDPSGTQIGVIDPVLRWPAAGSSLGLLFDLGGRIYLEGEDGIRGYGHGVVHAANGPFAASLVCDATLTCRHEIIDLETGETTDGGEIPTETAADGFFATTQAADGSIATVRDPHAPRPSQSTPATLYVTTPDGRSMEASVEGHRSLPVWMPGDLGLLLLTHQGLMHYAIDGDELVDRLIPGLLPEGASSVVFVPHSASFLDP